MSLLIVSCLKSQLASDFANAFNVPLIQLRCGSFADKEVYVDVKESDCISGSEILFVHQFFFNKAVNNISINDQLIKFLVACNWLKNIGAKKITAVLPYLAYSRHDKSFCGKFIGPIKLWGHFFKEAGIDKVFACDLHSEKLFNLFDVEVEEISLVDFWAEQIKSNFRDEIDKNMICVASPDAGGLNRASAIAQRLGVPMVCVEKKRIAPDSPVAICLHGNINAKMVILIDDIIDTGKTATQASLMLKKYGATKIIGIFTHAIFAQGSINCLTDSEFYKVYVSNSLLNPLQINPIQEQYAEKTVCSINKYLIQKIQDKKYGR